MLVSFFLNQIITIIFFFFKINNRANLELQTGFLVFYYLKIINFDDFVVFLPSTVDISML